MSENGLARRGFLWMGLGTVLAGSRVSSARAKDTMSPDEFRTRLEGPILSFPTPYRENFEIDHSAVRVMISRALDAGVKVFTLTAGNNEYDTLAFDEVKKLTTTMVEAVAGKGITLAATGGWWTGQVQDYARFAQSAGVDGLQVFLPAYGEDEDLFEHVRQVARTVRTALVIHGKPSLALMRKLMTVGSVVGFKEEFTTDYTVPLYREFGDRLNIFAGGTKARFLEYRPYGMRAYYSAFATFAPQVAMAFWNAVRKNDIPAARDIIYRYDVPFFEKWSRPFWHATLEHFGIARRIMRPPNRTFSEREMEQVNGFYEGLGLRRNG